MGKLAAYVDLICDHLFSWEKSDRLMLSDILTQSLPFPKWQNEPMWFFMLFFPLLPGVLCAMKNTSNTILRLGRHDSISIRFHANPQT